MEEAQKTIEKDPFLQLGIAEYHITEFFPTKYSDSFKKIIF